jgi:hypothetical protein
MNTALAGGFDLAHVTAVTDSLGNSYAPDGAWTAATPGAWAWRRDSIPAALPAGTVFTFTLGAATLASAANGACQVYAIPSPAVEAVSGAQVAGTSSATPSASATAVTPGGVALMFLTIGAAGGTPAWDSPAAAVAAAVAAGPITVAGYAPVSAAGLVTVSAVVSSSQAHRYKLYVLPPVGPPPAPGLVARVRMPDGSWERMLASA